MAAFAKTALGRDEKLYVVPETTYGAAASNCAATDAARFLELQFSQEEQRDFRTDKRATRSYLQTIQKRKSATWSLKGYLLPSGAAGTAPDGWDELLKALFGTQTINASTSVVYTLAKEYEKSVTLHRAIGHTAATAQFAEMMRGAVPMSGSFTLSGAEPAMVSVQGFGADVLRAGTALVVTDSGTSVAVTSGKGSKFDAGMYIDVGAATAQLISAVSTDTITTPSHSAATVGDNVVPSACTVAQTFVSTAVPISGILGSCTLEGASLNIISAQINLNNNAKPHNDRFGAAKTTDFHLANRSVEGSITLRLDEDNFNTIAKTRRLTNIALTLVSGITAGSIATFSLPNVMIDYTPIPSNAEDDLMVTLAFKAYGSSGEDEISLTLT